MAAASHPLLELDDSFARELDGLVLPWQAAPAPAPRMLAFNVELALELGLDPDGLRSAAGLALLTGTGVPDGVTTVAQAYAGHQFGGYSPRLGDGRALLLGELIDVHGRRRDLHLKGSGRTPFARGGDGKAAVGPMLREFVIGEAMHALGIPTTRALAVVATGEQVVRETMLPGAVLARVAASHLRVGTFEYTLRLGEPELLRRLADYAIARHHPQAAEAENPYAALLAAVIEAQAALIARWMHVGFVHGVMNTDNMTISGETIDYGPCAFIDAFDPTTVFSSIDQGGRYAYGNQPPIAQWNLARLAESLLPLIGQDTERAVGVANELLASYPERFRGHWVAGMRDKLGLAGEQDGDGALAEELLPLLHAAGTDHTTFFRALAAARSGEPEDARSRILDLAAFDAWMARWQARFADDPRDPAEAAAAMDRVNPVYIPRNHLVEDALSAATAGDLAPFERLLDAVTTPFEPRPGFEAYAEPGPADDRYVTFCGT